MTSSEIKNIGIVGGGNMGEAVVAGIYDHFQMNVCELDKIKSRRLKKRYKVKIVDLRTLILGSEVIILAVKPQVFESVLVEIKPFIDKKKVVISIAAGITSEFIEKNLGEGVKVVRTMPNLPAQIGQGITAICRGKFATKTDIYWTKRILSSVGKVEVVPEELINAITAVSGSGPAYFFLFVENYLKGAKALGLNEELSYSLILQTIKGSLALLENQKEGPHVLRQRVTSKGGTTSAALEVLMSGEFKYDKVFTRALKAAKKRAEDLST